jgi:hypothetical protein
MRSSFPSHVFFVRRVSLLCWGPVRQEKKEENRTPGRRWPGEEEDGLAKKKMACRGRGRPGEEEDAGSSRTDADPRLARTRGLCPGRTDRLHQPLGPVKRVQSAGSRHRGTGGLYLKVQCGLWC